jgi:hypothetical protein
MLILLENTHASNSCLLHAFTAAGDLNSVAILLVVPSCLSKFEQLRISYIFIGQALHDHSYHLVFLTALLIASFVM